MAIHAGSGNPREIEAAVERALAKQHARVMVDEGGICMTNVLMMLGDFAFHLRTAPYTELSRVSSYRWAAQDRIGRVPEQQYLGTGSGQITLTDEILPQLGAGFDQLDTLRAAAAKGRPLLLVDGRGNVWGDWVVSQIDETASEFYADGAPRVQAFTITLRGKAAALGGGIKDQKSRSWDQKTRGEIVKTITGDHGLKPKIATPLDKIKYAHLDQTDESGIHFLNRIGRDHDAIATVKGGALIVMAQARVLTVSGLVMLHRPVGRAGVLSYNMTAPNQMMWKSVTAPRTI